MYTLPTGSKISVGCIIGIVVVVDEDIGADILVSAGTIMKKGATGAIHTGMCRKLGVSSF